MKKLPAQSACAHPVHSQFNDMRHYKSYPLLPKRVSFGTTEKMTGDILHCTYFFRDDLNWKRISAFLNKHFDEKPMVIYHACSDGSEAFTTAIAIKNYLGENAEKFFPIMAHDISTDLIEQAKKGIIGVSQTDLEKMQAAFPNAAGYFHKLDETKFLPDAYQFSNSPSNPIYMHQVSQELSHLIQFEARDLLQDTSRKFDKPCIIFIRNVMHELPQEESRKLIKNLKDNLKDGSVIIFGEVEVPFNRNSSPYQYMIRENFEPVEEVCRGEYTPDAYPQRVFLKH